MNDPDVRALLARHGLTLSKNLGQNFLRSGAVLEQIASAARPAERILEIGAGIGSLTVLLCREAGQVVTVEIDRSLEPLLRQEVMAENHRFLWSDILKCSWPELAETCFGGKPFTVVGNLPYYITTDILMALFRSLPLWEQAVLMVQKEVADRLFAAPGGKDYRAASVLLQSFCSGELLFDVPPGCFFPPPHVTSTVLRLRPRPDVPEPESYIRFVQACFAARRKQLAASPALRQLLQTDKEGIAALLREAGLPADARGETFSPGDFRRLYNLAQKNFG